MARLRLPSSVQLPTGGVLYLASRASGEERAPTPSGGFFSEAIALFESGSVTMRAGGEPVDVRSLDLRDFHALRAILTKLGWLDEEPVEIACRNCQRPIEHRPCAALELGPFVDRELQSPVLDVTLDLASCHEIPEVRLQRGAAHDVTLSAVRVGDALPLFAALDRQRLRVTPDVVRGMGVVGLGEERSARKIARALQRASDETWSAITDLYLEAHYSPRLFSVAMCPDCGARNDVDAPYEREFAYDDAARVQNVQNPEPNPHPGRSAGRTKADVFPTFEAFADRTRAIAEKMLEERGLEGVEVVAEGGVPACDDGGEPLLGSYLPPYDGDAANPSRPAAVTVYYRTFRAVWVEDGPYDWDGELKETVDHELAHHAGHLAGDDPMDEEEHQQIEADATEIVGQRALARGAVFGLYRDLGDFTRRTWPIWVLAFIATVAAAIAAR